MKIRTQDGTRMLDCGDVYIAYTGKSDYVGVYVKSRYYQEAVLAGIYSDAARGNGVILEISLAYRDGKRIFYMPTE